MHQRQQMNSCARPLHEECREVRGRQVSSVLDTRLVWSVALLSVLFHYCQHCCSWSISSTLSPERKPPPELRCTITYRCNRRCWVVRGASCGLVLAWRIGSAKDNVGPADLVARIPPFLIGNVSGKDLAQALDHFGHPAGVAVAATANKQTSQQQGRQRSMQRGRKNRGGRSGAGRKKRGRGDAGGAGAGPRSRIRLDHPSVLSQSPLSARS